MSYPYDNEFCGFCDASFIEEPDPTPLFITNHDTEELVKVHGGECCYKLREMFNRG